MIVALSKTLALRRILALSMILALSSILALSIILNWSIILGMQYWCYDTSSKIVALSTILGLRYPEYDCILYSILIMLHLQTVFLQTIFACRASSM